MTKFLAEKYIGASLTDDQFQRALKIQNAQSFNQAFSEIIGLLKDVEINSPTNYEKVLAFAAKNTGIAIDGLKNIITNQSTLGAAFIVNEALSRADKLLPESALSELKGKTIQHFSNSIGSQGKFGKAFAVLTSTLVKSGIDFSTIYTQAQDTKNYTSPHPDYTYEDRQNETYKAIQESIKESGLVKVKSKGFMGKTYYLSINDEALGKLSLILESKLSGISAKISKFDQSITPTSSLTTTTTMSTTTTTTHEERLEGQLNKLKESGEKTPFTDEHKKKTSNEQNSQANRTL